MAANWTQLAQYLNSISPKAMGQSQPYAAPVTQADMGQVNTQPPPVDPTAGMAPPIARAPAARLKTIIPRSPAAGGGGTSTFAERTPQGDLERIRELWDRQQGDVDKTREDADKLEKAPLKSDLSWLAGLTSAWGGPEGQQLAKSYEKPLDAEGKAQMLAKLRMGADATEQGIIKDRTGLALGGDKNDMMVIKALLASQNRGLASEEKNTKLLDKLHKDLGSDLNIYSKARTVAGNIGQTNIRFSRLATLLDSLPTLNPNSTEWAELSEGLAAALGGTGGTSEGRVQRLLPATLQGKVKNIQQWLLNEPTGTDQQEFVKRYIRTVNREQDLSNEQLKELAKRQLSRHQTLWEKDGDNLLLQAGKWGIPSDEVREAFTQGEVKPGSTQLPRGIKPGGAYEQATSEIKAGAESKPRAYSKTLNKTRVFRANGQVEELDGDQRK